MKQKIIFQPSCSELITRLDVKNKKEALKFLKKLGIKEISITENEYYGERLTGGKEIRKMLMDKDNPNSPDFEHLSGLSVSHINDLGQKGWFLEGHQHCQHQLFPSIKKVVEATGNSPKGFDGGNSEGFEEWVEQGCKPIEYHNQKHAQKREKLLVKYFKVKPRNLEKQLKEGWINAREYTKLKKKRLKK